MSTSQPRPRAKLFTIDRVPSLRQSTAHLLGAYIYRERRFRRVSGEVFVQPLKRTEAWLAAVERGDIVVTPELLAQLQRSLNINRNPELQLPKVNLFRAIEELEARPYGELASALREEFAIPLELDTPPEVGAPISSYSANPVVASIRATDRVLILTPLLVFVAMTTVGVALLTNAASLLDVNWALPVLTSGALFTIAALFLDRADRGLDRLAKHSRSRPSRQLRELAREIWDDHGLPASPAAKWYSTQHEKHLLRGARRPYLNNLLLADFSERLAGLLALSCLLLSLVAVMKACATGSATSPLAVFLTGLGVVTWGVHRTASRAVRRALHALARGCGLPIEDIRRDHPLP